jgi:hypothetical protein
MKTLTLPLSELGGFSTLVKLIVFIGKNPLAPCRPAVCRIAGPCDPICPLLSRQSVRSGRGLLGHRHLRRCCVPWPKVGFEPPHCPKNRSTGRYRPHLFLQTDHLRPTVAHSQTRHSPHRILLQRPLPRATLGIHRLACRSHRLYQPPRDTAVGRATLRRSGSAGK